MPANQYQTLLTVPVSGFTQQVLITVEYDHQPAETTVLYPVDSAYCGCGEGVEITGIFADGENIEPFFDESMIEALEREILASREAA